MSPDVRVDGGHPTFSDRAVVLNPVSGSGDHATAVRRLATERGFSVHETERPGDAVELANEAAADGASVVAAAGGDGTVNEVVRGLDAADALDDVSLAVVPAGTGNNFAENVGVEGLEHAFEVVATDNRRRIDVGDVSADDGEPLPFLNSCVGGITAEASADTTSDSKSRLGVAAYVLNTFRTVADFEPIRMHLDVERPSDRGVWSGDAVSILIGNGRRFPGNRRTQANMEDGVLDVTILERVSMPNLAAETLQSYLSGENTEHIVRMKASTMTIQLFGERPVEFSLDGEMVSANHIDVDVRPRVLELFVGDAYEPDPEED